MIQIINNEKCSILITGKVHTHSFCSFKSLINNYVNTTYQCWLYGEYMYMLCDNNDIDGETDNENVLSEISNHNDEHICISIIVTICGK